MTTQPWTQRMVDQTVAGTHRIKITPPHGSAVDVTYFRNIPTQLNNYAFSDPFGPSVAEIAFPQISIFEALGGPGLEWLADGCNVDILWEDAITGELSTLWEGYITSISYAQDEESSSVTVQCKGALFQVDNFLAYPQFPPYPIPYELLIRDGLNSKIYPTLRTMPLKITFPDGWATVVPDWTKDPTYMIPYGVQIGQKWTGITTRNTGSWNKMLTGQIQSLLSLMFTEDGSQWTVVLNHGRTPELKVRQIMHEPDDNTLEVTAGQPGLTLNLTEDWTQAANVYYGSGTDTGGVTYSNMQVSSDGTKTSYAPFAALRQVHPSSKSINPWFDSTVMRREVQAAFDTGISPSNATAVALNQLQRSTHPGFTGSVTLKVDPAQLDQTFSRFLIQPGMTMLIHGFRGMQSGLLVHIAEVTVNVNESSVDLTIDSKFRDLLTVQQVQARAKDALSTLRTLRVGTLTPIIQDQRLPWSYAAGSGVIPSAPGGQDPNATDLFTRYGTGNEVFPWLELTKRFPPKSNQNFYISIPAVNSSDFNQNWSHSAGGYAIPVLFAEQCTIRLTQIAAYDQDGNVMPIKFHVSFYPLRDINVTSMPSVPGPGEVGYLPSLAGHIGQRYPFFPGAFEKIDPNGADKSSDDLTKGDPSLVQGWGNYYQGAGFYPSLESEGANPTGLLVDETAWSVTKVGNSDFQLRPDAANPEGQMAGMMYVMIYAESIKPNQPVYFLGRCFRQEPGTDK